MRLRHLSLRQRRRLRISCMRLFSCALLLLGGLLSCPARVQGAAPDALLFVGASGAVLRYDGATGAPIDAFIRLPSPYLIPEKLTVGPDGDLYILTNQAGFGGGQVRRYDLATGALIDVFVDLTAQGFVYPTSMAFGPGGDLYVGGQHQRNPGLESAVARFDGRTGALIDFIVPQLADGLRSAFSMAFGPDGDLYVGATSAGVVSAVQQYDGATGAFVKNFIPGVSARDLLFEPDGRLYVIDGVNVSRYDGRTGGLIDIFAAAPGGVELAFGPDGNLYVLEESGRAVRRYNRATGAFIDIFIPPDPNTIGAALLFYPSGGPPLPPGPGHPAEVTVTHRSRPALQAAPADIVADTIRVVNRGRGGARDVVIVMPFDPASVEILDARFSRPTAWVSRLRDDALEIRTGPLADDGDAITATLTLRIRPEAAIDTTLDLRLAYSWINGDVGGGGDGRSNALPLAVGPSAIDSPWLPLTLTPERGASGAALRARSAVFAPGEPIALWYNRPAGAPVAVGRSSADASGALDLTFDSAGLPPGDYTMVAQGLWSDSIAVEPFSIE